MKPFSANESARISIITWVIILALKASPSSQHQHCTDETRRPARAQTTGKSSQLTRLFVECLPEDVHRQAFVDLGEILSSSLFFFLLPFQCTLLLFWWFCSLPFWGWASSSALWFSLGVPAFSVKPCLRICLVQLSLIVEISCCCFSCWYFVRYR